MINSLLVMAEKTPPTTGLLIFILFIVVLVLGFIILVREIRERARLERLAENQYTTLVENETRIDNLLNQLKRSDAQAEDFKDKWYKSNTEIFKGNKSLKNYMNKLAEIEKYVHSLDAKQGRITTRKLMRNFMDIIMGEFEGSQHEDS